MGILEMGGARKMNADYKPKPASAPATAPNPAADWVEKTSKNGRVYIANTARGHDNSGESFTMINEDPNSFVTLIQCFTRLVYGEYWVLKALHVEWNDGAELSIGDHSGKPSSEISFDTRSKIQRCDIRAGGFVDGIDFTKVTELTSQKIGGSGGNCFHQNVGNGRLVGFIANKGTDIGMLGLLFGKD